MKKNILFLLSFVFAIIFLSSCLLTDKERAIKVYSNSNNFVEVECNISGASENDEGDVILLLNNIVCLTPDKNPYNSYYCIIILKNKEILNNNKFAYNDENKLYKVTFCPCIMWDGGLCHILSISDEETVYLDYESGKNNVLDWLESRP